ncbi:MAG TPA: hypothetical protein VKE96_34665 [Vicinamibacterales bacterium]|nr:hypothetical protein [Vicinamibacterales bacterium]
MRRAISSGLKICAVSAVIGAVMTPAPAAAQQSINFSFGGFSPRSEDARDPNDVLVQNRTFLDFNVGDLTGPTFSGEWLIGLGTNFDAGLGVGFYQHTTTAADRFSEFDVTGAPILADLKLRVVPFNATFRWLPLGRHRGVVPYVGAGVGVFGWRYSESGDFVASDNVTIIHGNFVGSGSAVGPVILGGVSVPVGSWSIGGELKYQAAEGTLPADQSFAGTKIDLGGLTYAVTFGVRF